MKLVEFLYQSIFSDFKKEIDIFVRIFSNKLDDEIDISINSNYDGVSKYAMNFIMNNSDLNLTNVIRVLINKELSQILYVRNIDEVEDSFNDFLGWMKVYYHLSHQT